jgi:arylsulfatase A-like enzyme
LIDQALRFLQAGTDRHRPWALFLWLAAPHPPLIAPSPWFDTFAPEDLTLPANVGKKPRNEPPQRRKSVAAQLARDVPQDQWRRVWSAYLGLTHWADHLLGKVLSFLSGSNLISGTTVVFTSDHGDMLGQHDMYQKMEMYEPALRVPLMIFDPSVVAAEVDTPVSHLDILPTLSQLMGLGIEEDLDGISLVPCLRGSRYEENSTVHSQYSGNPGIGDLRRSVVTNRHKFIVDDHAGQELYDLQADPLEMDNLAGSPQHRQTLETLRDQARQWGQTHGDWFGFKG